MSKMKAMEMQFLRRYEQLEYQLQEIRKSQNVSTEKTNSTNGTYDYFDYIWPLYASFISNKQ